MPTDEIAARLTELSRPFEKLLSLTESDNQLLKRLDKLTQAFNRLVDASFARTVAVWAGAQNKHWSSANVKSAMRIAEASQNFLTGQRQGSYTTDLTTLSSISASLLDSTERLQRYLTSLEESQPTQPARTSRKVQAYQDRVAVSRLDLSA